DADVDLVGVPACDGAVAAAWAGGDGGEAVGDGCADEGAAGAGDGDFLSAEAGDEPFAGVDAQLPEQLRRGRDAEEFLGAVDGSVDDALDGVDDAAGHSLHAVDESLDDVAADVVE